MDKTNELGKIIVQQNRERLAIRKLIRDAIHRRSLGRKKLVLHPRFRQRPTKP